MVEYSSRLLDRTFGALADPTRRRILAQLAKGDECVTDLARPHAMSLAAVSKAFDRFGEGRVGETTSPGTVHSLALEAKPMQEARAWIDRYAILGGESGSVRKIFGQTTKAGKQT